MTFLYVVCNSFEIHTTGEVNCQLTTRGIDLAGKHAREDEDGNSTYVVGGRRMSKSKDDRSFSSCSFLQSYCAHK
jgi:hypothetical protein